jgi:hypothetical protein
MFSTPNSGEETLMKTLTSLLLGVALALRAATAIFAQDEKRDNKSEFETRLCSGRSATALVCAI